jgi:hypothetical protein
MGAKIIIAFRIWKLLGRFFSLIYKDNCYFFGLPEVKNPKKWGLWKRRKGSIFAAEKKCTQLNRI